MAITRSYTKNNIASVVFEKSVNEVAEKVRRNPVRKCVKKSKSYDVCHTVRRNPVRKCRNYLRTCDSFFYGTEALRILDAYENDC